MPFLPIFSPGLISDERVKAVLRNEKPLKPKISPEIKGLIDDIYDYEKKRMEEENKRSVQSLQNFLFKNADLKPEDRIKKAKKEAYEVHPEPEIPLSVKKIMSIKSPEEYSKIVQGVGELKAKEHPVKSRIEAHMNTVVPGLTGDLGKGAKTAYPGTVLATELGKMYAVKSYIGHSFEKIMPGLKPHSTVWELSERLNEFGFDPSMMKKWMLIKDMAEWTGALSIPTFTNNLSEVVIGGEEPTAKKLIAEPLFDAIKGMAVGGAGAITSTPYRMATRMGVYGLAETAKKLPLKDGDFKAIAAGVGLVGILEALGGPKRYVDRMKLTYLQNNAPALAGIEDLNFRENYLKLMGKSVEDIAHDPVMNKIFKTLTDSTYTGPSRKAMLEHIGTLVKSGSSLDKVFENISLVEREMPVTPVKSLELNEKYEKVLDDWIGERQWQAARANAEALRNKDTLKKIAKANKISMEDADEAMKLFIDTHIKPDDVNLPESYDSKKVKNIAHKKKIRDLSQNLPDYLQKFAFGADREDQMIGDVAVKNEIIKNKIPWHVRRGWKDDKSFGFGQKKFGRYTPAAKHRVYNTILEGWAKGKEMDTPGLIDSLRLHKTDIYQRIADRKFIKDVQNLTNMEGYPVFTTKFGTKGYEQIRHPNFFKWIVPKGKTDPIKVPLYAPKEIAKELNNILGTSEMQEIPGLMFLREANNLAKAITMQGSFHHDIALTSAHYMTKPSYVIGEGFLENLKQWNIKHAYNKGHETITTLSPYYELLIRNGMTDAGIAPMDWERTKLDPSVWFRPEKKRVEWLFGKYRNFLKANSGVLELKRLMHKYPLKDINELAKAAGQTVNHIFGGENLMRLKRNPLLQDLFKIIGYSPDFTEGTFRLGANLFGKDMSGEVARRVYARVYARTLAVSILMNMLLHGSKTPETYVSAWKNGKLRLFDVDITPIYKELFGGEDERKRYLNITGQFKDILRGTADMGKVTGYKLSPVAKTFYELIKGETWEGRKLTGFPEFAKTGKWEKYAPWEKPENFWSRMPSQAVHTILARGTPNLLEKLILFGIGEEQAFDTVFRGIGARVSPGKSSKKKGVSLYDAL